jgi:hypothetical protein
LVGGERTGDKANIHDKIDKNPLFPGRTIGKFLLCVKQKGLQE